MADRPIIFSAPMIRALLDGRYYSSRSAVDSFEQLWTSLHGPDAWDANPWVCALTFTVQHGNIDAKDAAHA